MKRSRALPLLLAVALTACSGLAGEPAGMVTLTPPQRAPADLANGARVFAERCSSCHGNSGAGDGELALSGAIPEPGDFTQPQAARQQSPQQWLMTIRDGRLEALMPPWRDALSADELRDVALYSYTLHYRQGSPERGRRVLEEHCPADCARLDSLDNLRDPIALDALSDEALRAALPETVADEDAWAAVTWLRTRDLRGLGQLGRPFTIARPVRGSVSGRIENGTANASVPPGLQVILLELGTGAAPTLRDTLSAADGSYHFADVLIEPGHRYRVLVEYGGRRFPSAQVSADPDQPQLSLPITIYETGADPGSIAISALVQRLEVTGGLLQIVQVARYRNRSDRLFSSAQEVAPGQHASLTLPLPAGARAFPLPEDSGRYVPGASGNAVTDTLPVFPGADHLVQLAWRQPWDGAGTRVELPLAQALDGEVRILLPPTLTLSDADFVSLDPQQVGTALLDGYGAQLSLAAGTSLGYTLMERAQSLPAGVISGTTLALGALLTVGAVVATLHWNRRRSSSGRRLDAIAQQIAELDAAHEHGTINHDFYRRQRAELQLRLDESMEKDPEREV